MDEDQRPDLDRCRGRTLSGERCRARVTETNYCWRHDEQGEYEREMESAYAAHQAYL